VTPPAWPGVGSLVESAALYPYLSDRENLKVVADLAGVPQSRIDPVLDEVDLTLVAHRRFGTYSTGMKQRLGVAAALLKSPELLPTHRGKGVLAPEVESAPARSGSKLNPTYSWLTPDSFSDFEWLVLLDSTTYPRGGPSLSNSNAG
jgi:hypothetical protein